MGLGEILFGIIAYSIALSIPFVIIKIFDKKIKQIKKSKELENKS